MAPSAGETSRELAGHLGGPGFVAVLLVAVGLGALLSVGLVWLASMGVRERWALADASPVRRAAAHRAAPAAAPRTGADPGGLAHVRRASRRSSTCTRGARLPRPRVPRRPGPPQRAARRRRRRAARLGPAQRRRPRAGVDAAHRRPPGHAARRSARAPRALHLRLRQPRPALAAGAWLSARVVLRWSSSDHTNDHFQRTENHMQTHHSRARTALGALAAILAAGGIAGRPGRRARPDLPQRRRGRSSNAYTLVVPNESASATIESVEITVPEGVAIGGLRGRVRAGRARRRPAARATRQTTTKVTWTGGETPVGEAAYFRFTGRPASDHHAAEGEGPSTGGLQVRGDADVLRRRGRRLERGPGRRQPGPRASGSSTRLGGGDTAAAADDGRRRLRRRAATTCSARSR